MPVEADLEISVFLDVRELLLEPDSALRLARRAFSCAAKEDGTTRQCDSSNILARVLARDGCRRAHRRSNWETIRPNGKWALIMDPIKDAFDTTFGPENRLLLAALNAIRELQTVVKNDQPLG